MKSVLITGGTGSFGKAFVRRLLGEPITPERICVLSRDEFKQNVMRQEFGNDPRLRFFLGDVRDRDRLYRAFTDIEVVVHAAALKQVPAGEYDPEEFVKTNVYGSANVLNAAMDAGVKKVLLLSTDKACAPCTLYGATKLAAERLFVAFNSMRGPICSATRYGNVADSRGSVIPLWREQAARGEVLNVTDLEATRFYMTQDRAVDLVLTALDGMSGGEIFVPVLRSYRLAELAAVFGAPYTVVGLRGAEKLHESMVSRDEDRFLVRHSMDVWKIMPEQTDDRGRMTAERGFCSKDHLMSAEELRGLVCAS